MISQEDAYHFAYRLAKKGASFNAVRHLWNVRQGYDRRTAYAPISNLTFRNLLDGYNDARDGIAARLF